MPVQAPQSKGDALRGIVSCDVSSDVSHDGSRDVGQAHRQEAVDLPMHPGLILVPLCKTRPLCRSLELPDVVRGAAGTTVEVIRCQ